MKKKILALLLAILTVLPLLVACGTSYYQYDTYKDFIKLGNPAEISVMEADIEKYHFAIGYAGRNTGNEICILE